MRGNEDQILKGLKSLLWLLIAYCAVNANGALQNSLSPCPKDLTI